MIKTLYNEVVSGVCYLQVETRKRSGMEEGSAHSKLLIRTTTTTGSYAATLRSTKLPHRSLVVELLVPDRSEQDWNHHTSHIPCPMASRISIGHAAVVEMRARNFHNRLFKFAMIGLSDRYRIIYPRNETWYPSSPAPEPYPIPATS